ncbi:hypothetical protein [Rhodococcus jostii]|nr:hypothetical protein [Rhodococcus jostii]
MEPIRISSAVDAAALAVSLAGHLPTSEVVVAPLDEKAFGTVLLAQLPEVVSEADREEWVEVARERVGDIEALLVVVFGSPAHAELVVQALREAAPDRTFHTSSPTSRARLGGFIRCRGSGNPATWRRIRS